MVPTVTPSTPTPTRPMPMARCAAAWLRLSTVGAACATSAPCGVFVRDSGMLMVTSMARPRRRTLRTRPLARGVRFERVMTGIDRDGRPERRAVERTSVANDLNRGLCADDVVTVRYESLVTRAWPIARQLLAIARARGMGRGDSLTETRPTR